MNTKKISLVIILIVMASASFGAGYKLTMYQKHSSYGLVIKSGWHDSIAKEYQYSQAKGFPITWFIDWCSQFALPDPSVKLKAPLECYDGDNPTFFWVDVIFFTLNVFIILAIFLKLFWPVEPVVEENFYQ